jgi:hypothetical protein
MSAKTHETDPYKEAIAQNLRAKTQRMTARTKVNGKSSPQLELIVERTKAARVNRQQSEILAAKARGQLIEKATAREQADFIASTLRQRILGFPRKHAPRLAAELGVQERDVLQALEAVSHELCNELVAFGRRVSDPNWLRGLEDAAEGGNPSED